MKNLKATIGTVYAIRQTGRNHLHLIIKPAENIFGTLLRLYSMLYLLVVVEQKSFVSRDWIINGRLLFMLYMRQSQPISSAMRQVHMTRRCHYDHWRNWFFVTGSASERTISHDCLEQLNCCCCMLSVNENEVRVRQTNNKTYVLPPILIGAHLKNAWVRFCCLFFQQQKKHQTSIKYRNTERTTHQLMFVSEIDTEISFLVFGSRHASSDSWLLPRVANDRSSSGARKTGDRESCEHWAHYKRLVEVFTPFSNTHNVNRLALNRQRVRNWSECGSGHRLVTNTQITQQYRLDM